MRARKLRSIQLTPVRVIRGKAPPPEVPEIPEDIVSGRSFLVDGERGPWLGHRLAFASPDIDASASDLNYTTRRYPAAIEVTRLLSYYFGLVMFNEPLGTLITDFGFSVTSDYETVNGGYRQLTTYRSTEFQLELCAHELKHSFTFSMSSSFADTMPTLSQLVTLVGLYEGGDGIRQDTYHVIVESLRNPFVATEPDGQSHSWFLRNHRLDARW